MLMPLTPHAWQRRSLRFPGALCAALLVLPANVLPGAQSPTLPQPAAKQIDFAQDIAPIFNAACTKCHGKGKSKGGFNLESRQAVLDGGSSGPAVVVGRSAESYLIELVAGTDPDNVMPQKGTKLTAAEVGLLRAWIDQGLAWDDSVSFSKSPPINLHPVDPELPRNPNGPDHPIDRWLQPYFQQHEIQPGPAVEDRIYARRVYLDLIGLLPTPSELDQFLQDERPDKRERLADALLADKRRYAGHWLSFWNDLLRNDYRGTGYIDGGRKQITGWLYDALADNKPFDQFVRELINPSQESEGFIKGIVWRGVVNASQTPQMQAAQNISQVFMGVNLKCASCHDSFINDWALADAYGMASIYAEEPLPMFECDKPTGQTMAAKFLYDELGEIPATLDREARQARLAEIMTSPENGRLTRTVVNRLWRIFMGQGLVEPVDDMEQPAWYPDLLHWLAQDLAEHDYDLKRTMKLIVTSQAYQLPSVDQPERSDDDYVFRGPTIRRMSAEQFRDALGTLTGVWYEEPDAKVRLPAPDPVPSQDPLTPVSAHWIWAEDSAARRALPETVYFRKVFHLDHIPDEAVAVTTCDNSYTLFVNGHRIGNGNDYQRPNFVDLRSQLKPGPNVLAIAGINHRPNNQPPGPDNPVQPGDANPAGLLCYVRLRIQTPQPRVLDFATDASWNWSREAQAGWHTHAQLSPPWPAAAVLGDEPMAPWNFQSQLDSAMSTALLHDHVRASLVASDPLQTALGRPPREQLLTVRTPTATTLQGLELTNGETLNALLREGAQSLLESGPLGPQPLTSTVFNRALGRNPTPREQTLALELLGEPVRADGVEDLLWSVAMLPEFQLIY